MSKRKDIYLIDIPGIQALITQLQGGESKEKKKARSYAYRLLRKIVKTYPNKCSSSPKAYFSGGYEFTDQILWAFLEMYKNYLEIPDLEKALTNPNILTNLKKE